jgi:hypothetical protein
MTHRPFRTNCWLWAIFAFCLFVGFGFVDPMAGRSKGSDSLWRFVAECFSGDVPVGVPLLLGVMIAVPAVAFAWVIQAVVVVVWSMLRARTYRETDGSKTT